jgi:hypothetical protein
MNHFSEFEGRVGFSDTILKGNHPRTIPVKVILIWVHSMGSEDI